MLPEPVPELTSSLPDLIIMTLLSPPGSETTIAAPSKSFYPPPGNIPPACLACRGKHLKCDGSRPCSRCTGSYTECIYIASRRGYKSPRKPTAIVSFRLETTPNPADVKPRLTPDEVDRLELEYSINPKPSSLVKTTLAEQMGVEIPRINNWFQNRRAKDKQIQKTLEFERVREEAARSGSPSDHAIDHARSATPPRSASVTARPLAEPNNGMFGSQDRQYAPETSTEQPLLLPASLDATTSANSSINEDIAGLMDRFYSLMGQWYFWRATQLPSRLQPVQGHGGSGKNTESTGDGARTTASTKLGKDHTRGSVSNPPLAPERRFPRDEEDDSDEERQHKKPKLKDSDTETQRLACPYFKRNPTLYRHWRSCPGPGWGTVHRVKEHIYRCHLLPPSCPRCHETFESEKAKLEHLIASEPCTVRDKPRIDGVDSATHELLRSRKLLQGQETEVAKWRAVYLALFPDTNENDVPSPFYEYPATPDEQASPPTACEFATYEKFLTAELPTHIRRKLSARVGAALDPRGEIETLKSQIVDIVRDTQLELFQLYRRTCQASVPPPSSESTASAATTAAEKDAAPDKEAAAYGFDTAGYSDKSLWLSDRAYDSVYGSTEGFASSVDLNFGGFDGVVFDFTGVLEAAPTALTAPDVSVWDAYL